MLSADSTIPPAATQALYESDDDEVSLFGLADILTWLGEKKALIAGVTVAAALLGGLVAFLLPVEYTAHATFLAPVAQQQSGSAAALQALGAIGLPGGVGAKSSDELYVALLKSDTVQRSLAQRFDLKTRYEVDTFEALRKAMASYVRVSADKRSGLIGVDVDDKDPQFAASLANAHQAEITKLLARLAVTEAQLRRVFFEKQLQDTKEALIKAEQGLQAVQEKSGVIVLDKQAEALITNAALLRAQISEREVQLKVLRTSATEQNPAVIRLGSEVRALRGELARLESAQGGAPGNALDMPVGKIPEAAVDYVRARRELKLQETLLEGMVRQYEMAKLDEAKEGPSLQQVDIAVPPDRKSKPSRGLIVLASAFMALVLVSAWVVLRRYAALLRATDPASTAAWRGLARAWSFRR